MKEKTKVIKKKIAKTKETAKKVVKAVKVVKKVAKKPAKNAVKAVKKVAKRSAIKKYTLKPLVRALKLLDVTAAELARRLSCNQSFVSKWLYELNEVPLRFAAQIEELTAGKIKAKAISPELYAAKAKKEKLLAKALAKAEKKAA